MTKEDYDRIMNIKEEKYKEKLENEEINPFQRIVRNCELSYDCVKTLYKNNNWTTKLRKRICKDIRSLIKVRNNLLEDQRLVEKWRLSLVHPNFTPKQLSEYFKYCQKMFSDFEYSIFNTFKVPKLGFYRESNDIDINEASDISESENNDEDVGLTCSEPDNE